ncbi:MAG: uL15 family ribosomal protein [Candidatus Micrarchaeia archaeon]
MVNRKGKRNRKFLGSKSHGGGNAKNRRGKGNKGGWGRAGTGKHRFTYITSKEREFLLGAHGFVRPKAKKLAEMNLYEINNMARKGQIEKKDGKLAFTFRGKVLSEGALEYPVVISAAGASKAAVEKIKASGGEFKKLE